MYYKAKNEDGKVVKGDLFKTETGKCYLINEINTYDEYDELYHSEINKYKVKADFLRRRLDMNDIYEGDVYLDPNENKLVKINSLEDIKPHMIKISDDYDKLMLNELDLAEWFEPQSDFKYGDMVYQYIDNSEIEEEKVIYSGVTIIITEFELDGDIQRNVYCIEEFKRMFENENKWSRWFQYRRVNYNYEIPTLIDVQYRIKNKSEIQMKGRSKINGEMLKASCKLAEGDTFSVYDGTKICALKLHKKVLDLRIKEF